MKVMLAVDAGGTKTKVALINNKAEIVFEMLGGCGSPAAAPAKAFGEIERTIRWALAAKPAEYVVNHIVMGISGLGSVEHPQAWETKFQELFGLPVIVRNDALIGLYSILTDQYQSGIMVLSGTGSAVYGKSPAGEALVGGWGHLLTEAGSGYALVRRAVVMAIEAEEAGMKQTPLTQELVAAFGFADLSGFKKYFYNHSKAEIARWAEVIVRAARAGEANAQEVLIIEGTKLATSVLNLCRILKLKDTVVIGYRGGFITKVAKFRELIEDALTENGFKVIEAEGKLDPVFGCYYYGLAQGQSC